MARYDQHPPVVEGIPENCTLRLYRKKYASEALSKSIRTWATVGYILCGLNVMLAVMVDLYGLLDVAIMGLLILGIQLTKDKLFAVTLMVVSIVNCVLTLFSSGSIGGWWWIILAWQFLSAIKKIDTDYKILMAKRSRGA